MMAVTTTQEPKTGLSSVLAAVDLLDCFSGAVELGVCDVARRLGVAKSTAHRLLTTLSTRGFVEKDPETRRYRLGLRLFELGDLVINRHELRQVALPLLAELRRLTGCTVHLAVPDGADIVYVERLQSPTGMRLLFDVGRRYPSHATSSGKVIAAFNPSVAELRRKQGFPALTAATIRTAADYEAMLAETRRAGYAVNRDEAATAVTSVAAPVRNYDGTARAAISIVGATSELAPKIESYAGLVIPIANRLARSISV